MEIYYIHLPILKSVWIRLQNDYRTKEQVLSWSKYVADKLFCGDYLMLNKQKNIKDILQKSVVGQDFFQDEVIYEDIESTKKWPCEASKERVNLCLVAALEEGI